MKKSFGLVEEGFPLFNCVMDAIFLDHFSVTLAIFGAKYIVLVVNTWRGLKLTDSTLWNFFLSRRIFPQLRWQRRQMASNGVTKHWSHAQADQWSFALLGPASYKWQFSHRWRWQINVERHNVGGEGGHLVVENGVVDMCVQMLICYLLLCVFNYDLIWAKFNRL